MGNSSQLSTYQVIDSTITCCGNIYYRLRYTDYDGHSKYSAIEVVHIEGDKEDFVIFPNPAESGKSFFIKLLNTAAVRLEIMDGVGRVVFMKEIISEKPTIDLNALMGCPLRSGLYTVSVFNQRKRITERLVVF